MQALVLPKGCFSLRNQIFMPKVLISDTLADGWQDVFATESDIQVDNHTGLSEDELCDLIPGYEGLIVPSSANRPTGVNFVVFPSKLLRDNCLLLETPVIWRSRVPIDSN